MTTFLDYERPVALTDIAPDGRIGLCALSTDYCIEQDLRRMIPDTVEIFTNRIAYRNPLTVENLRAMEGDIERTAENILPGQGFDVGIYGCTSGTAAIGFDRIRNLIQRSNPGALVTTPLHALVAATTALNISSLSVLTPYNREMNESVVENLRENGIDVINLTGLGFEVDIDATKVPLDTLRQLAVQTFNQSADALFISCTNFRASLVVDDIEKQIGKPVLSSNQCVAWHALKLLDCDFSTQGFGSLMTI
ncbi:MAG: Asp/Glu racemase [Pseudomonadota bacterium]